LGIVLGMICIRSRSLIPGIAFHFVNNVLAILHGRMGEAVPETGVWNWLFRHSDGMLRYQPALLCLASLAAIALLHRLTRHPRIQAAEPVSPNVDSNLRVLSMS
jgi:sodium transport system permease protein